MSFLSDDRMLWFLTRGTGVVVLVLLTASMALGVLATTRVSTAWWPRFVTQAVHRNIALVGVALVLAHALVAIGTGYLHLGLIDIVVPFAGAGRPFWSSLGTISLDLVLIATATGLARNRFGRRWWRAVHTGTYLAWPLALAHGLGMGTDKGTGWSIGLTALCVGAVAGAVSIRLAGLLEERTRHARPAPVARPVAVGAGAVPTSTIDPTPNATPAPSGRRALATPPSGRRVAAPIEASYPPGDPTPPSGTTRARRRAQEQAAGRRRDRRPR